MSDTTRLKLPLLAAAQAQKHVTHNEALQALDVIVQLSVRDRDLAAPPPSPLDGYCYIVGSAATGAWSGKTGQIAAWQDGVWNFYLPNRGWVAYVEDEDLSLTWNGSSWLLYGPSPTDILTKLLTVDGTGSGLDADRLGGLAQESHGGLRTAQVMMIGGDVLSLSATFDVKWSARIMALAAGQGAHWSTGGYFQIDMPASGTVTGIGGAVDKTVTANGIPLAAYEALFYVPTIGGSGQGATAANFRVVGYTAAAQVPQHWLCLAIRDTESGDQVRFWNGVRLGAGESYDQSLSSTSRHRIERLGIGTSADATNRLAVAANAILFNDIGSGIQVKLSKASAASRASLLLQTNFSGRAEIGLVNSDDLKVKVSPDGTSWFDAISVDRTTGQVSFPSGTVDLPVVDGGTGASTALLARSNLGAVGNLFKMTRITASQTFTPDAETKAMWIRGVGGGGGGGAAASIASGAGAAAGGGAGAEGELYVTTILASYAVTIGAAGLKGSTAGASGNAGGQSSFGSLMSLAGGQGGLGDAGSTAANARQGGLGGSATVAGGLAHDGGTGQPGILVSTNVAIAGSGASSSFGNGGQGVANTGTTASPGVNATGFGAGGSGGRAGFNLAGTFAAGGDGTAGYFEVWEFR